MPAILANAKNMLISTDYPMDKIVLLKTGSVPIDGYPHNVAHGLPFVPLLGGYWSMTSDFSIIYEFSSGDYPSSSLTDMFAHEVAVSSDSTNIILDTKDVAGDSKTAYYRVYGFEPSDSEADLTSPIAQSDNFVLNTDYNYMKLYSSGTVNPGTATSYTISHGLGYKPQIYAWYTFAGYCYPIDRAGDTASGDKQITVDNTSFTFINTYGFNVTRLDWRIYLDE